MAPSRRRRVDGVARGAESTSSAKRAKVDEAKEEEDALVRRKEELVVAAKEARSRKDARAERVARRELLTLCAKLEAKNEKLFSRLLPELWQKILDEYLHQNDMLAFAMTCRFFREKQKGLKKRMKTNLKENHLYYLQKSGKVTSYTLGWFRWVCDTLEIQPGWQWLKSARVKGAVSEGYLLNYAALQGSVEVLRWLMEEKDWELNEDTGRWAGMGGSVELFEYLRGKGYEFNVMACAGAARGGHLKALQYLRGMDPPCSWDVNTCAYAAWGGQLEVLQWLRAQDPPCPWDEDTCAWAAQGGHLEVLKWARSQDPPCPWDEETCTLAAMKGHLEVLKWARSQDPPCPWDAMTCAYAAKGGHLDVLKWARSQDPPCTWSRAKCIAEAMRNGHLHIVTWIDQQEDDSDDDVDSFVRSLAEHVMMQ